MKTSHALLEFGVDQSNDIQRRTLTLNHMRNMCKTLLFLLGTALIIETRYCLCVPLVEFVSMSFCPCVCHHFRFRVVMFSTISSSNNVRFVFIAISFVRSCISCFICNLYLSTYTGI